MHVWLVAGLASFLIPAPRAPKIQRPVVPPVASRPVKISKPGTYDFAGKIYVMGRIPAVVVEYGIPSLQVTAKRASISNFAWRGSMESLHVGSQPFTPQGMRQRHAALQVTLKNLFCDDVGEDCVSIQPRSCVTIRNSQFEGKFQLTEGTSDSPGHDKLIQIDGAQVTMEHCDFFHGVRVVRGKANSTITLRHCRFVHCHTCVIGDGDWNPRPANPYDNGRPGPCRILVEDCEFWDCEEVARAFPNCTIELVHCKIHRTKRWDGNGGGIVSRR